MKCLCCWIVQCFNDLAAVGVHVGEEWRQSRELFWAGAAASLDSHHTLERVFIVQVHKKAGVLLIFPFPPCASLKTARDVCMAES
ncbi:hypothetical protein AMEX_G5877 [Astyanax mexicanus]|uniref:Secreted protein n=1 Tax=Astyanax mexicanus TaxID=7994 RepID=A0A8T2MB30_ASTMX|nr:hypothetical protein AMEX_G5877 [Astyanax mexicanus]